MWSTSSSLSTTSRLPGSPPATAHSEEIAIQVSRMATSAPGSSCCLAELSWNRALPYLQVELGYRPRWTRWRVPARAENASFLATCAPRCRRACLRHGEPLSTPSPAALGQVYAGRRRPTQVVRVFGTVQDVTERTRRGRPQQPPGSAFPAQKMETLGRSPVASPRLQHFSRDDREPDWPWRHRRGHPARQRSRGPEGDAAGCELVEQILTFSSRRRGTGADRPQVRGEEAAAS